MKMIILVQSKKTKKIRSPNQKERKADLKAIKRRKIKKRMGLNKMEIKKR